MTAVATPAGLDWHGFSTAHFPGSRRHDMEALIAYGAYKRSLVVDDPAPEESSRALETWEDEGGPAL